MGRNSMVLAGQVPRFPPNANGFVLEHREYIGDVFSSSVAGAFNLSTYRINPGAFETFPWLSSLACQFEQWEPLGMVVAFKSTSAMYAGTTQALGTVIIASDYDPNDSPYTSKMDMENAQFSMSCKASESMLHPLECDPAQRATRLLFVETDTLSDTDKKFTTLANLQVATVGVPNASTNLGELWITYSIKFHKPHLCGGALGGNILSATLRNSTSVTAANLLGNGAIAEDISNFAFTFSTTNDITLPAWIQTGLYWVMVRVDSTAVGTESNWPTLNTLSGCEIADDIYTKFWSDVTASTGIAGAIPLRVLSNASGTGASFKISNSIGGTISACYVTISQGFDKTLI